MAGNRNAVDTTSLKEVSEAAHNAAALPSEAAAAVAVQLVAEAAPIAAAPLAEAAAAVVVPDVAEVAPFAAAPLADEAPVPLPDAVAVHIVVAHLADAMAVPDVAGAAPIAVALPAVAAAAAAFAFDGPDLAAGAVSPVLHVAAGHAVIAEPPTMENQVRCSTRGEERMYGDAD